ncbi:hypothetical protein SNEBB_001638 [Seison nebaliae]|nr:hypothetical protein SNEBB_001638 [Seison nebaliae]
MNIHQIESWRDLLKSRSVELEKIKRFAIPAPTEGFKNIFRKFLLHNGNPTACVYEYCSQRKILPPNIVESFHMFTNSCSSDFCFSVEFPQIIKFPIAYGKNKKRATNNAAMIAMIYLLALHEEEILDIKYDINSLYDSDYQLRKLDKSDAEWLISESLRIHNEPENYMKYLKQKMKEIEDISILFRHAKEFTYADIMALQKLRCRMPRYQLLKMGKRYHFETSFSSKLNTLDMSKPISITINIEFDETNDITKELSISNKIEHSHNSSCELLGERKICDWALIYLLKAIVNVQRQQELSTMFDRINSNIIREIQNNASIIVALARAGNQEYFGAILQTSKSGIGGSKIVAFSSCAAGVHQHRPKQFFQENVNCSGRYLHDMSIITTLKRSFCMYLTREIEKYNTSSYSIFENVYPEQQNVISFKRFGSIRLRKRSDIWFNLYLNFIPDGGAKDLCDFIDENKLNNVPVDQVAFLENVQRDGSNEDVEMSDETVNQLKEAVENEKKLWSKGCHIHNLHESYARDRVAPFHVKNVKFNQSTSLLNDEEHSSLPMSSCDKILQWQVIGWQGGLLSSIINPIYMNTITIADKKFHYQSLCSSFCCRLVDFRLNEKLPTGYIVKHPYIGRPFSDTKFPKLSHLISDVQIKLEGSPRKIQINSKNPYMILYAANHESCESIDTAKGLEAKFSEKKTNANTLTPMICKLGNFNRFRIAWRKLNDGIAQTPEHRAYYNEFVKEVNYQQLKKKISEESGYSLAKQHFREHVEIIQFGKWKSASHLLNRFSIPIN